MFTEFTLFKTEWHATDLMSLALLQKLLNKMQYLQHPFLINFPKITDGNV